jgi:hypothetical protein
MKDSCPIETLTDEERGERETCDRYSAAFTTLGRNLPPDSSE